MYIQPDVIYSHLLIDQYNGVESCIHLGIDNLDIVKQSYIQGETSEEIYTWHSDEKMKRIESQRDELLKALRELLLLARLLGWDTAKACAAIKAVEGETKSV